jgi:glycosyltransferase involved in cell wall biosynthesis
MTLLSGVIITYNEADRLEATLESIKEICDEIVVIDSGSTDETISIAERFNCKIFTKKFEGYGVQKQFAIEKASNDWVLVIDADEVVSIPLANEIKSVLTNPTFEGYYLPRIFMFLGKAMKGGNERKKKYLRLFNRHKASFSLEQVHEDVVVNSGKAGWLQGSLWHYSYRDISHYFSKFNQYTSLGATEVYQNGSSVSVAYIVLRMPITFFQYYWLKGYFRDGYAGFLWSLFSSLYPVVKYAKARELRLSKV